MAKSPNKERKRKRSNAHHHQQQQPQDEETPSKHKKSKLSLNWSNLDLILSLQHNDLNDQRKIELAFEFIDSDANCSMQGPQIVSVSRVSSFLNDWIQPLLIPREKSSGLYGSSIDFRCWAVLRFCLKNSSMVVSLNLLKSVTQVLKYNDELPDGKRLLETVIECLELILTSNARAFYNANMDVWKACVIEIVGAIHKSLVSDDGLSRLSCLLLENFANFMRFHKDPTSIFSKFIDGLLEPLLELLVLLHLRTNDGKCGEVERLVRLVEDVLTNGLFHPANIDGFFSLRSSSTDQKIWAPKGHREFFKKLGSIIIEKKAMVLWGSGYLFRLFVTSAKTQKGVSLASKHDRVLAKGSETSDEHKETNKSLFDVFVQFMQPLLAECKRCSKKEFPELGDALEDRLLETHGMLKSVNETLVSFIHEKIYTRTDDTSEGAHYKFLKEVYDTIVSVSGKIYRLWVSVLDMKAYAMQKMLLLLANDVVAAIGYFLEIEHKVVEEELVKIWLIMLSFLAVCMAVEDSKPSLSLASDILNLGCKLINIYSDLRQVNCPLFALCKAVRLLGNNGDADVSDNSKFFSKSLSSHFYVKSAEHLLCSQEFCFAISYAIKLIPEGQVSGCIQQLEMDVTDSLKWMRLTSLRDDDRDLTEIDDLNASIGYLDVQAELFGRILSELYVTLLDSLTVTATNSISIGNSVKNLMAAVGLSFSTLVQCPSGNVDEFIYSVIGRRLCDRKNSEIDGGVWISPMSLSWILVLFFRIYISCRSLYRQLISLMPPESSLKAAKSMGCFFTAAREGDWREGPETMDEGYFSWIVKPSISLLDLIKFHLNDLLLGRECPSLVYVLHIMVLQRFSDLNRLIKAFEFFEGLYRNKSCKQWKRLTKVLKQEATELTNFVIGYSELFDCKGPYKSTQHDDGIEAMLVYDDAWDLGICSLNEKSLRIAIWRLLCQNIDVWCPYATKKYLKKFLSCLFLYSVQDGKCSVEVGLQIMKEPFFQAVTMQYISLEFLSNIISYEQPSLRKHFASGFCLVLEKSMAPLLSDVLADNSNMGSLPDWSDFLNILKKRSPNCLDEKIAPLNHSLLPNTAAPKIQYVEQNEIRSLSFSSELRTCERLLNILSKTPVIHLDAKSFSIYATYVLNVERLVVSKLLDHHGDYLICYGYELLRLFASCRRVLKYMALASLENNLEATRASPFFSLFDSSDSMLWLLKSVSVVVGLPHAFHGEKYSSWVHDVIFPLIDHTSYIFLAVSERQMNALKSIQINDERIHTDCLLESMAEMLQDQVVSLGSLDDRARVLNCSKFAVNISCFQGFLWGLASAVTGTNEGVSAVTQQFCRLIPAHLPKLSECITLYEEIIKMYFSMDDKTDIFCTSRDLTDMITDCSHKLSCTKFERHPGNHLSTSEQSVKVNASTFDSDNNIDVKVNVICEGECHPGNHLSISEQSVKVNASTFDSDNNIDGSSICEHNRSPVCERHKGLLLDAGGGANVHSKGPKTDLPELQNLKASLLQSLMKGEDPQIAFTVRQLFTASAANLKLKSMLRFPRSPGSKTRSKKMDASSTRALLEISVLILRETTEMVGTLDPFSFVWLDGLLTFLEVVGSSNTNLNLSEDFYTQLFDAHLKAIGKCISLQGKFATLPSHETGSSTKMLQYHNKPNRNSTQKVDQVKFSINMFKARLRISLKSFIRPANFGLLTALRTLESAIVGAQQGCNVIYEINTGKLHGEEVSSNVAAGIDCLEMVLESLPGHELVLEKISSFINAIFNIILHLQNPTIFYLEKQPKYTCEVKPDAGSVVLMCVEILANITSNGSFRMDPWQVSQCLHIPVALFNGFHQLNDSIIPSKMSTFVDNQTFEPSADMMSNIVDRKFSVELYASCCRLLYTTLKHRKRLAEGCIALLEESVSALLNCLEMVDNNLIGRQVYFSWELKEAIKCASFLRRIYEEIRNQKEAFAEYAYYFLSDYICMYSGHGPLKRGIKREIDEALRPGIYSLIDVCSEADFQQLHIALPEGACRSTLKTLLHDYRVNFQYEGKI